MLKSQDSLEAVSGFNSGCRLQFRGAGAGRSGRAGPGDPGGGCRLGGSLPPPGGQHLNSTNRPAASSLPHRWAPALGGPACPPGNLPSENSQRALLAVSRAPSPPSASSRPAHSQSGKDKDGLVIRAEQPVARPADLSPSQGRGRSDGLGPPAPVLPA